jgi:hypothetical protein
VTFSGNWTRAGGDGGGLCVDTSEPHLTNVALSGNATYGGGSGGAIYNQGGLPTLINVLINGNFANAYGGGLYNLDGAPTLIQVTIAGNAAGWGQGSGVFSDGTGVPVVRNAILWSNVGGAPMTYTAAALDVQYTVIEGGYPGTGNLDVDPVFVRNPDPGDGNWNTLWDNDNGDLRLLSTSPAIDAGDNGALPVDAADLDGDGDTMEPLPYDLIDGYRCLETGWIADAGAGMPPLVDRGAYEYAPRRLFLPLVVR